MEEQASRKSLLSPAKGITFTLPGSQACTRSLSILRNGSAAPHNNWSPTVKAERYSPPMASLRNRPTGIANDPVTAAGVNSFNVLSRSLGTTFTQLLEAEEYPRSRPAAHPSST